MQNMDHIINQCNHNVEHKFDASYLDVAVVELAKDREDLVLFCKKLLTVVDDCLENPHYDAKQFIPVVAKHLKVIKRLNLMEE